MLISLRAQNNADVPLEVNRMYLEPVMLFNLSESLSIYSPSDETLVDFKHIITAFLTLKTQLGS